MLMTTKQSAVAEKIVEKRGHITGKDLIEIGYSEAQAKNPKQVIRSKAVQSALQKALKRQGITLKKALAPIAKGLEAQNIRVEYKTTTTGTGKDQKTVSEPIEHHEDNIPLQLQASDRAMKLLNLVEEQKPTVVTNNEDLVKAINNNVDEVELSRLVFRKDG